MIRLIVAILLFTTICAEKDYTDFVKNLKENIENTTGDFYHSAYNRLAYISDTYGPRIWGGQALEQVIFELASMAKKDGFDNVHLEPVSNFTKWVRGNEALTLYSPRPFPQPLGVIGLGRSISGYSSSDPEP
jgi:carboxypeptidase Q